MRKGEVVLLFAALLGLCAGYNPFPGDDWETGRIDLGNGGDRMFYYLVRSRKENTPLIAWVDGGPGYSSAEGCFIHHGPYILNTSDVFQDNNLTWITYANMIYLDNPVGVGYSHQRDNSTLCRTETCVARNLYTFFQKFVRMHPEFTGRDFYITGESYAGHYAPYFASYLLKSSCTFLNLKGIGVGNGLFDFYEQLPYYPDFLLYSGNTTLFPYLIMRSITAMCVAGYRYEPSFFDYACNWARLTMAKYCGIEVIYDITWGKGDGVNYTVYNRDMDSEGMREAIGAGDDHFREYNPDVFAALADDKKLSLLEHVGILLDSGVRVMIWFGDKDYLDNWMCGRRIASLVPWEGQATFNSLKLSPWRDIEGVVKGEAKEHGGFKFVKVYNAGHSIFDRQREAGLQILKDLLLLD